MKARKELIEKAQMLVCAHPAFAGADEEKIRLALAGDGSALKEAAKGQVLYPTYLSKGSAVLVLGGSCHLLHGGKIVKTVGEGFIIGFASDEKLSLKAAESCKAVYIKRTALDEILDNEAESVFKAHLESLMPKSRPNPAKSLARHLIELDKAPRDLAKIQRQLNFSREEFSRALEVLYSCGAVSLAGAQIKINKEKLEEIIHII